MISRIVRYNKRDLCRTVSGCFLPVNFRSSEIGICWPQSQDYTPRSEHFDVCWRGQFEIFSFYKGRKESD